MDISNKEDREKLLNDLSKELQNPYWDSLTVEKDLDTILQTIHLNAQNFHETDPELTSEEAKIHAAAEMFDNRVLRHPAVVEFLVHNKEYGILKHLDPDAFNHQVEICLGRVKAMCNDGGDDHLYFSLIETVGLMFNVMDVGRQNIFQVALEPLLASSKLSFTLFLSLVAYASEEARKRLLKDAVLKWKHNFLSGLREGNLGAVHDALFWLAHRRFLTVIQEELLTWKEVLPYVEDLLSIKSIPSLNESMEAIIGKNFKLRMEGLTQKPIASSSAFSPMLESILYENELGFALRKLHLFEQLIQEPHNPALLLDVKLILAMEKGNFILASEILQERFVAPWEPLSTGDTLVEIAGQAAMSGRMAGEFYLAFHKLVNEYIQAKHPKSKWTLAMEVITQAAFCSNGVFIGKESGLFLGKWKEPESLYRSILKIYLPEHEHCLWKKYCINPNSSQLGDLMLDAYQGGAETYGLWFHLMQKVLVEKLEADKGATDWQTVFSLMGNQRRSVGLFLNDIQVPNKGCVTLAAKIRQEEIDKVWPGSPLNFGVPDTAFNVSHTTMLNEIRAHYLEKTAVLIHKFNHFYARELEEMQSSKEHFKEVRKFDFSGREFLVYPIGQQLAYAIIMPFKIDGKSISGIHILWGWPSSSAFFCAGHLPKRTPAVSLTFCPIWVHPSGEDKQKIFKELERLFLLLIKPIRDEEEFEQNLALFIYLFSQSVSYKRGSASIGLILLSAILTFHGRNVPDAPAPPFFLDCEAMCATQEEFTTEFIIWLLTGVFE